MIRLLILVLLSICIAAASGFAVPTSESPEKGLDLNSENIFVYTNIAHPFSDDEMLENGSESKIVSDPEEELTLETLTLEDIFFEPYLPGVRPNMTGYSADMSKIYFSWNDSSYHETSSYQVDLGGNQVEETPEDAITNFQRSPALDKIVYTKDGKVWVSDIQFEEPKLLIDPQVSVSNLRWSPDGTKIAFTKNGEIWITSIEKPALKQVTRNSGNSSPFMLDSWAGNERMLLRSSDFSNLRTVYFPDYLGEFVTPGESRRGIPATTFAVADLASGDIDTLFSDRNRSSTQASPSGRYVAVDYSDPALKQREIRVFDLENGEKNVVFEDSTEGWLYATRIRFNPERDLLMFQSEQDNWNHIYTVEPDGSNLQQHTFGDFDIPWAEWVDAHTVVFASTEEDLGVRQIYTLNVTNGQIDQLTDATAYRYRFSLSPDKRHVVYAKTYFNRPYDLYRVNLERPEQEVRLTRTVPERFKAIDWQKEDYIRFTGRDGETELSMSVLYPPDFDPGYEYPVVVFYHGAGSLQNVYKGWSNNYYREYMFHQYLTMHGYVVVEVDFRHSTGYGRKFREDVTNWMGKYETWDTIDGLDWVQENVGGLDLNRVGTYGGSYGGFMALYSTSVEPERFHAAAALRAVTNWRNYYYANPWYTKPRLGHPDEEPEHYDRSSPLTYAEEMEHPVLILHGLIDDNVGFQDAVQYIEELIQSGHEDFDMMMYPSERHGFVSPESWYDEYRRMFEFFEKYLKD